MLAYQLMTALKSAWDKEMTKIWVRPYKILVTGPDSGILEPIVNAPSVHQIKKMEPSGLQVINDEILTPRKIKLVGGRSLILLF